MNESTRRAIPDGPSAHNCADMLGKNPSFGFRRKKHHTRRKLCHICHTFHPSICFNPIFLHFFSRVFFLARLFECAARSVGPVSRSRFPPAKCRAIPVFNGRPQIQNPGASRSNREAGRRRWEPGWCSKTQNQQQQQQQRKQQQQNQQQQENHQQERAGEPAAAEPSSSSRTSGSRTSRDKLCEKTANSDQYKRVSFVNDNTIRYFDANIIFRAFFGAGHRADLYARKFRRNWTW